MHLYILCRGIKHDLDRFINELSSKYLPFDHKTKGKGVLQVSVRPIQLYEVVFPKEHLSSIVNTMGGKNIGQPFSTALWLKKYIKIIQKFLKLKEVNGKEFPIDENAPGLPCHFENIGLIGLGIKEDKNFEDGTEYI